MMTHSLILKLETVEYGKTQNWLLFRGFIPQYDINKLYTFEFCGTDLITSSYLTDAQVNQLRRILSERFGYPPYNDLRTIQFILNEEQYNRIELSY